MLRLQMQLARDLGYTLMELSERMTPQELQLWDTLYEVEAQERQEASRKARRR
jgi:hypothetical protein